MRYPFYLAAAVPAALFAALVQAYDVAGTDVSLTGFAQLTAAKVTSGSAPVQAGQGSWSYQQWNCPCAIQHWEYAGVYEKSKGWQADQESLLGVQAKARFTPQLSATVQAVARGANNEYRPTVDWAYLSYKVAPGWTLQAGRKRIPLYYYSDFLYIGYAYPWVRPPADVYGWPIFTYDGVNASYQTELGDGTWSLDTTAWYGNFDTNSDIYDSKIYYGSRTDERWTNIRGAFVNLSNGVVGGRLMYMIHRDDIVQHNADNSVSQWADKVFTRIMGASFNVDYDAYLVRSEFNRFEQSVSKFIYNYYLVGAGYRYKDVTGMLTFSHYMTEPNSFVDQEGRNTRSVSLRWDFYKNLALKAQYDISHDESKYSYPFFGDHKLLSVSLQGIF